MRRILAVLMAVSATACDQSRDPVSPVTPTEPFHSAAPQGTADDPVPDQLAVAEAVPGFGGYYIDEAGRPTVWLTDVARRPEAEAALAGFLDHFGFTTADLRVREATYTYQELDGWYRQAWPRALSVMGAVFSDLDESQNRLRFGAVSGAVPNVSAALSLLGIPAEAIIVEPAEPIHQLATLRDRIRPARGGLQISFFAVDGSPLGYACTLGFNATKDGAASFITNSHCSNVQGGSEVPTTYYQPVRNEPENVIGVEVHDPHYWVSLDCPVPGFMCRYSDALRAEYAPGLDFALGRVARPLLTNDPTHPDFLTIDESNPAFRLIEEQARSVVGETAHKVGRTTGWTSGRVTETCINSIVLGSEKPIIQLCQTRVEAGADSGDSGSPVFRPDASGNATLLGILWGGSVSGTPSFVFSPMFNVQAELGPFVAVDPLSGPGNPGGPKGPKGPKK
jgi:hypothetical protein